MSTQIFINLPVADLKRSMEFFARLGFDHNPQFTDDTAACIVISQDIYVMILTHDKFKQFTNKDINDSRSTTEVINCLSCDSKEQVNELADKALGAGGSFAREPMDYGFMYARSFQDPDGHLWEVVWMDPAAMNQGQPANAEASYA